MSAETLFQPLYERVLIRPAAEPTDQPGIQLPDALKERPLEGEVLAVAPDRIINGFPNMMYLQPGDRVAFGKYAGTDITLDGEDLKIMREEEVLGKLL